MMPSWRGWILRLVLVLGSVWVVTSVPPGLHEAALAQQPPPTSMPTAIPPTSAPAAIPPGLPSDPPPGSPVGSGPDQCAGDERITYIPEEPRVGGDLLIAVTSSRPHQYPHLAGTDKATAGVRRPGQLGTVWEWSITTSYPGQHEYVFYVDSTIPCQRISLTVSNALATSTPKPTRTPKPVSFDSGDNGNGNGNGNDNEFQPTATPVVAGNPTSTGTAVPVAPAIDRFTGPYLGAWTDGTAAQTTHLDQLGAGWTRAVAVWGAIETADNTYSWADLDGQVNTTSDGGRRQVLVMVRNNPAWAAASRCKLTTDVERARLADFMTAMVNRYKDKVKYWQLYNEMDNTNEAFDQQYDLGGCFGTANGSTPTQQGRDNYARMLETVGAAIHAADSQAKVISGALVSGNHLSPAHPDRLFDADFARGVMASLRSNGTLDRVDYLAIHFFSSQAADYNGYGPDLLGRVNKLRMEMREVGLSEEQVKPIMVDEGSYTGMIGQSTADPNNAFNRAQRDYVAKALARAAAADVIYFWFALRDVGGGGLGGDNAYGLQAVDGTPKPSYQAFRYFTSLVKRQEQVVGRLSPPRPELEGYEFTAEDGRRFQVIWNEAGGAEISYSLSGAITSVTDVTGGRLADSVSSVPIGSEPRFIFFRP